jgi:hypothetical protein
LASMSVLVVVILFVARTNSRESSKRNAKMVDLMVLRRDLLQIGISVYTKRLGEMINFPLLEMVYDGKKIIEKKIQFLNYKFLKSE